VGFGSLYTPDFLFFTSSSLSLSLLVFTTHEQNAQKKKKRKEANPDILTSKQVCTCAEANQSDQLNREALFQKKKSFAHTLIKEKH